jgi:hypothetical protein
MTKKKENADTVPTALEKLKARLGEPTQKKCIMKEEKSPKSDAEPECAPGTALVFFPKPGLTIRRAAANRDDFDKLLFVCKARSGDRNRRNLTVLHVEGTRSGTRLIATEGKRLHVAETGLKIPSGNYFPYVTKEVVSFGEPVEGITYPNWAKVIPNNPSKKASIDLTRTGFGKDVTQTERLSTAYTDFVKNAGVTVNLRFIEDLPKTDWEVYGEKAKNRPLVFKKMDDPERTFAIMMPLAEAA